MLKVTLLGTAALMPLPERALTAATLSCAGRTILFDCGEGTQAAARRAGASLMKCDLIALTHYHGDHSFGLPGLLQTMSVLGRTDPLYLTGPEGLREAMLPIALLAGQLNFELRLVELPEDGLRLSELHPAWPAEARLCAFPTEHRVPSRAYRFELGRAGKFQPERARELGVPVADWGRLQRGETVTVNGEAVAPEQVLGAPRRGLCFAFSGDTAPCEGLERAARDADLFICEATYGSDEQARLANEYGHMVFAQAGQLAQRAGAKRLWLAHFSQRIEDPADYLGRARVCFPEAECGADGRSTELRFED